jgi:hypothetical protein
LTLRDLKVGDRFRWKKPPFGYTDGKVLLVNKPSGFAAPEGWDFMPIDVLDGEVELLDEHPER